MGRLSQDGVLFDCSMAAAARASSGMAFDGSNPALRAAMARDSLVREYQRLRTAPTFDVDVDIDVLRLIPRGIGRL